jgi:hypothetical protein
MHTHHAFIAPAAERNKQPILTALAPRLPSAGVILEVASGTGQHTAFFAAHLPALTFQPTEADPARLPIISAFIAEAGVTNTLSPAHLDAAANPWPLPGPFAAAFCANMIHITPWACAQGLFANIGRLRVPLFLYGPFRFHGAFTAPSNAAFDDSLRARDPAWGVRDIDDLSALALAASLHLSEAVEMPNNNHLLVWHPTLTP